MPRLTFKEKFLVSGIGVVFLVVFGLLMPWWLFVVFVLAVVPMFYKLRRL